VVIGAAAILLGPINVGDGAMVGANSVVIDSVPPGATVVGVPGRTVEDRHKPPLKLEHGELPDPVAEAIRLVLERQKVLEDRVRKIEEETP
jgi:serine O-acetyltransferase